MKPFHLLMVVAFAVLLVARADARPVLKPSPWAIPMHAQERSHTMHGLDFEMTAHHRVDDVRFVRTYQKGRSMPGTVQLDQEEDVDSLHCSKGELELTLTSAEAAAALSERLRVGIVVAGSQTWGCVVNGHVQSLFVVLLDVPRRDGAVLTVATRIADYTDAFEHLELRFESNHFGPEIAFHHRHLSPRTREEISRQGGRVVEVDANEQYGLSREAFEARVRAYDVTAASRGIECLAPGGSDIISFLQNPDDRIRAFLHLFDGIDPKKIVDDAIKAIKDGITYLQTGSLHVNTTSDPITSLPNFGFNYDTSTGRASSVIQSECLQGIQCTNCYFRIVPTVDIYLSIVNNQVQGFHAYITGHAYANLELNVDPSTGVHLNFKLPVDIPIVPSISLGTYMIPVSADPPLTITLEPFIEMGFNVELDVFSTATITAGMSWNGSMTFGMDLTPSGGKFNFQPKAVGNFPLPTTYFNPATSGNTDVNIVPYLTPQASLRIEYLGGPVITFRPNVQVKIQHSPNDAEYCKSNFGDEIQAGIDVGLGVDVGGAINFGASVVQLIYAELVSLTVFEATFPIARFCLPSFKGSPPLRGDKFIGLQTTYSNCSSDAQSQFPDKAIITMTYKGFGNPGLSVSGNLANLFQFFQFGAISDFCPFVQDGFATSPFNWNAGLNNSVLFENVFMSGIPYSAITPMVVSPLIPGDWEIARNYINQAAAAFCGAARVPHVPSKINLHWEPDPLNPTFMKIVGLDEAGLGCPRWDLIRSVDLNLGQDSPASSTANCWLLETIC